MCRRAGEPGEFSVKLCQITKAVLEGGDGRSGRRTLSGPIGLPSDILLRVSQSTVTESSFL
jgi:hypothetical protein